MVDFFVYGQVGFSWHFILIDDWIVAVHFNDRPVSSTESVNEVKLKICGHGNSGDFILIHFWGVSLWTSSIKNYKFNFKLILNLKMRSPLDYMADSNFSSGIAKITVTYRLSKTLLELD